MSATTGNSGNSGNSGSIPASKFQELLARVKARAEAEKQEAAEALSLRAVDEGVEQVSLVGLGISDTSDDDEVVDVLKEIVSGAPNANATTGIPKLQSPANQRDAGVTRDVTLNEKQQLFITTMLAGEDCCLIGAAGTGKTTCVGKAITALVDSGQLQPLGEATKWLRSNISGVLITSFTRKAVNNIRRATPDSLKPHVLTLHKVLEFAPVFSEIYDDASGKLKKTMSFEPQRTELNPLPAGLKYIFFEESSMIGTDLYNLLLAACPHMPQEIFIGDIRQLPPIFGPAILGFKMALLPIVELTEVYRQANGDMSPILRLAHAVLSGDSHKFEPKVVIEKQKHPYLDKIVERKSVPSLQAFQESSTYGTVTIQPWQKTLPEDKACDTLIQQFIAWEKEGYYLPNDDIILCPFNKSFGTIEINKGIQQYLGRKRGAVVHEVIAGFNTYFFAEGDRVLYDKEDAFIERIERNPAYLGKSPRPASQYLDRWGSYQEPPSDSDLAKAEAEEVELQADAMDAFIDSFTTSDEEDASRVNAASHQITIRFAFSDEVMELKSAQEINALLGGNALTVHKMQGSENRTIFVALHKSHAVMINNELLYTAISRAREKLHIICEVDTFFKGVKTHKVRGQSLEDKIKFFMGKTEFEDMQSEMQLLRASKELKRRKRDESGRITAVSGTTEEASGSRFIPVEAREDMDLSRLDNDYDVLPSNVRYIRVTKQSEGASESATKPLSLLERLRLLQKKGG